MPEALYEVLQEHMDALCPELRAVVRDAERAGNPVIETWTTLGQGVRLKYPRPVLDEVDDKVRGHLTYTSVNDPHYWLGEIHCRLHPDWFVALPYGSVFDPPGDLDLPPSDEGI